MRRKLSIKATAPATVVALLFTLLPLSALSGEELALRLAREGEVLPGGVITVTLEAPATVERVTAALFDGDRELSGNYGVPLEEAGERSVWTVLLGVASTIRPGTYTLKVHAGPGSLVAETPVTVTPFAFVEEDIRLNSAISELRRDDDPRKREEALQMIALTNSFNRGARFWDGTFEPPLESERRTSRFGDRRRFIYADGGEARSIHNGIDLAAPTGTPIHAPGAGRVVFADDRIVTGKSVALEHFPGVYGLFYHLDEIAVSPGETVERGALLGTVGSTGVSTGPHLHWELRVGGVSVDPEAFLNRPLVDREGEIGSLSP